MCPKRLIDVGSDQKLTDADSPMTLVQVEICTPGGDQLVISAGTTIPAGSYDDSRWAEEYDETIAGERWQARGKLAARMGVDESELDSLNAVASVGNEHVLRPGRLRANRQLR